LVGSHEGCLVGSHGGCLVGSSVVGSLLTRLLYVDLCNPLMIDLITLHYLIYIILTCNIFYFVLKLSFIFKLKQSYYSSYYTIVIVFTANDSRFNSYAFQPILIEAEQLQVLISVAEELASEKFREHVVLR